LPEPVKKTNQVASAKGAAEGALTTNLTAQADKDKGSELNPEDSLAEDQTGDFDVNMDEAKRILKDLATLSSPGSTLAVTVPAAKGGDKKALGQDLKTP
jgi:hypothetical protein